MAIIVYDIRRIINLQDELIKEQYILRGELNAIMNFSQPFYETSYKKEDIDKTTTVEVTQ
jgi:hypothetical protein